MTSRPLIDDGSPEQTFAPPRPTKTDRRLQRRGTSIVPKHTVSGRTLVFLIAIMTFLSCVTLGTVILIQKSAIGWSADVGREVTIQVRPTEGIRMDDALAAATSIARAIPGVGAIHTITEEDSLALLEPWLGSGLDLSALAVPRLIVVEIADPVEIDLVQLSKNLETVRGATLDTHAAWQKQLNAMSGTMVFAGLLVLVLILTATVLAIVFATRGTMASNRSIVDVLHFIGASNNYIAGQFQGRFLSIGINGAFMGGCAALFFFLALGFIVAGYLPTAAGNQLSVIFGQFSIGWQGLLTFALTVPFIGGLTAITSRLTVRSFLRQIS